MNAVSDEIVTSISSMLVPPVDRRMRSPSAFGWTIDRSGSAPGHWLGSP